MTYTVQAGDTLSKIAARNGLTLAQLLQANPQITNPDRIKVGDVLTLPGNSDDVTKPLPANVPTTAPAATAATATATTIATATASAGSLGAAIADTLGQLSANYETGGRGPG